MAWMILKQPNGLYARFSTVVDDVTEYDMTEEEVHELCLEAAGREVTDFKLNEAKKNKGRFTEVLREIESVHGSETASERFQQMSAYVMVELKKPRHTIKPGDMTKENLKLAFGEDERNLKPCPFCGSDKTFIYRYGPARHVICNGCKATGPELIPDPERQTNNDWQIVTDLWNNRVDNA